jgi:hypothetical protein
MKLDFIPNINEFGESIVRLYEFNKSDAMKFRQAIQHTIIENKKPLELINLEFIESRNCYLSLYIADENRGIYQSKKVNFFCFLTIEGYAQIVSLLKPFCEKETKGYQWLYDIDTPIDFLFSPGGTW